MIAMRIIYYVCIIIYYVVTKDVCYKNEAFSGHIAELSAMWQAVETVKHEDMFFVKTWSITFS